MKNNVPFFSIITCTYNSEKYILDNLKSVDEQSYTDYEHLIIDGESTDSTTKIVEKNMLRRRKVISTPANGISNALNAGIMHSQGRYLIHLNSDDFLKDKHVLEKVKKHIEAVNSPDVVYGKIQVIEESGTAVGTFPSYSIFKLAFPWLLFFFNYVPHQSTFVKKSVFEKFGMFDEKLSSSMDYDLWLRIIKRTRWSFIEMVVSNYRLRAGAQSSDKKNFISNRRNHIAVIKKHVPYPLRTLAVLSYRLSDLFNRSYR